MSLKDVPLSCLEAIAAFLCKGKTGQLLVNINAGEIQSFEIKEHIRIKSGEEKISLDALNRFRFLAGDERETSYAPDDAS